jgi:hypothetical protein
MKLWACSTQHRRLTAEVYDANPRSNTTTLMQKPVSMFAPVRSVGAPGLHLYTRQWPIYPWNTFMCGSYRICEIDVYWREMTDTLLRSQATNNMLHSHIALEI